MLISIISLSSVLSLQKHSVGTIWSPANVCSVQFSSYSNNLLLLGSADYKIYCYDLRHTQIPWCTLAGHKRTVSYVKFLDSGTIVSASTDNCLKLWDLTRTNSDGLSTSACRLTYSGHTNEKVFIFNSSPSFSHTNPYILLEQIVISDLLTFFPSHSELCWFICDG